MIDAEQLQTLGETLEEALEEGRHLSVDAAGLAQRAAQNGERRALLGEALAVGLCVRLRETGPCEAARIRCGLPDVVEVVAQAVLAHTGCASART